MELEEHSIFFITEQNDPIIILQTHPYVYERVSTINILPCYNPNFRFTDAFSRQSVEVPKCSFRTSWNFLSIAAFFKHSEDDYTVIIDVKPHKREITTTYPVKVNLSVEIDSEHYTTPVVIPHCYLILSGLRSNFYKIVMPYKNYFIGWPFGNSYLYTDRSNTSKSWRASNIFEVCRPIQTTNHLIYSKYTNTGEDGTLRLGGLAHHIYSDFFDSIFNKDLTYAPMVLLTDPGLMRLVEGEDDNELLMFRLYECGASHYHDLGRLLCLNIETLEYVSFNYVFHETHPST